MKKSCLYLLAFALLSSLTMSCGRYPLHLTKLYINASSLASNFAGTKDPRPNDPINGEELVISWGLTGNVFKLAKGLVLEVIYKNFEKEEIYYPLDSQMGIKGFFVLGEKFKMTKGLLTYRATIVDEDRKPLATWTHKMWFNLLKMREVESNSDELGLIDVQLSLYSSMGL